MIPFLLRPDPSPSSPPRLDPGVHVAQIETHLVLQARCSSTQGKVRAERMRKEKESGEVREGAAACGGDVGGVPWKIRGAACIRAGGRCQVELGTSASTARARRATESGGGGGPAGCCGCTARTGGRTTTVVASTFYFISIRSSRPSSYPHHLASLSRCLLGDMGELNPDGLLSSPLKLVPLADPRKGMHPTGEDGLLLEPAPNAPGGYCPMLPW